MAVCARTQGSRDVTLWYGGDGDSGGSGPLRVALAHASTSVRAA